MQIPCPIILTTQRGLHFYVRADRREQDEEIIREVAAEDCYRLRKLRFFLPPVKTIVDVGGHIGSFGVLAKSLWPGARLVAFEPNPASCFLYRKNLEANGMHDAEVLQKAVAYEADHTILLDGGRSTGGCVLKNAAEARRLESAAAESGDEMYRVIETAIETVTFEDLVSSCGLDSIDLCKLDCEGCEFQILANMSAGAAARVRCLLGEYHCANSPEEFFPLVRRRFPALHFCAPLGAAPIGPFWGTRTRWFPLAFNLRHTFTDRAA